jgi:hypothetical protein
VGWTTPRYNLTVPHVDAHSIDVNTRVDFAIEADSTFTGATRSVLMEHEMGHVRIGQDVARHSFGDGLQSTLDMIPDFSVRAPVSAALNTAADTFRSTEGENSHDYDVADYPRMVDAYYGARNPLSTLVSASPRIAALVRSMRALISLGGTSGVAARTAVTRMQQVIAAHDRLSHRDTNRLQYNLEFRALLPQVVAAGTALSASLSTDAGVAARFSELASALADLTWSAEEALRNIGVLD